MKTKERGITLIALVVTIIVLLILAGVSIQMITGQSGILSQAREAKKQTEIADAKESVQRELMEEFMINEGEDVDREKIYNILKKYFDEVPDLTNGVWDTFPEDFPKLKVKDTEYEVDIADIYKGSIKGPKAGTEVAVPKGKDWDTAKVTPTSDGEENVIPIPEGFYYAGGTKDTGFVISDVENDDLNNTKRGNQFVWIPCGEGSDEVEYQQDSSLWREKYGDHQAWYVQGTDEETEKNWLDNCGGDANTKIKNKTSVDLYGGFYVGRFEAGLPVELSGTEMKYENITTAVGNGRDVTTYKPVSKKNNPSWNLVTQETARIVSVKMYEGNDSINSQLIDSYAWDTISEWVQIGPEAIGVVDNTTCGNYMNNPISILSGGLYAVHLYGTYKETNAISDGILLTTKYLIGPWTRIVENDNDEEINADNINTYLAKNALWKRWNMNLNNDLPEFERKDFNFDTNKYIVKIEIATGATESTKIKNIYDMAGNMWEYTTEVSTKGGETENGPNCVIRGGSFWDIGKASIVQRHGDPLSKNTNREHVGFRVVLYIQ